jgi:hypothetical protein
LLVFVFEAKATKSPQNPHKEGIKIIKLKWIEKMDSEELMSFSE